MGETLVNAPTESAYSLFKRGLVVGSVGKNNIHVVRLQPLQRVAQALNDVFPGQEAVVRSISASKELGGETKVLPLSVESGQSNSKLGLASAKAVVLSCIEEVDAVVEALLDGVGHKLLAG